MTDSKRVWVTRMHKYVANPISLRTARFLPGQAVLETTGRTSGKPRRTPVGGSVRDGYFWLVSDHGRKSQYVRNIEADPKVRVQIRGRWHHGTAELCPDDDPQARLKRLPAYNSAMVRVLGTNLMTIRIALDKE